jgi:hypothetical protein
LQLLLTSSSVDNSAQIFNVDILHFSAKFVEMFGFMMKRKEADKASNKSGGCHDTSHKEVHVGKCHALVDLRKHERPAVDVIKPKVLFSQLYLLASLPKWLSISHKELSQVD